jgi:SAM-dependent methyltransferase
VGQRVVEIGCGVGNFTGLLLDREIVVALDAEPDCVERLLLRNPGRANLHALVADAARFDFAQIARFQPDSCVCLNVLEHIEDDEGALRRMASVLEPGGVIVLLLPAFPLLYGPIDRNLGHYRRYTRGSVRRLAAAAGLRLRRARYMNTAGFFGWWANSHIFRREAQSESQIRVFDRYVVPAMSRLESLVAPPFGQSLFVVLRRP